LKETLSKENKFKEYDLHKNSNKNEDKIIDKKDDTIVEKSEHDR
jgi:hypothetical protein